MNCWTIVDMYNNFYWFHNLCEYFYSVWRTKLIKITIIFVISNPKWVCLSTICQNVKLCYRVVQISLGCVIIIDISAYKYVVIFSSDNWRKGFKVHVWIGSFSCFYGKKYPAFLRSSPAHELGWSRYQIQMCFMRWYYSKH